jgi:hypothetical protein
MVAMVIYHSDGTSVISPDIRPVPRRLVRNCFRRDFLALLLSVIIVVIFTIFSIHASPILIIVTFIFGISIAINIYSGHRLASKMQRQHANIRIHLMDARETKVVGTLVLPVANGVVFLPSLLCKPPSENSGIRFISWEAIKLVENIPPRKCSPS